MARMVLRLVTTRRDHAIGLESRERNATCMTWLIGTQSLAIMTQLHFLPFLVGHSEKPQIGMLRRDMFSLYNLRKFATLKLI